MRVLLVSLEYPPYSFGGVGSHVLHLSTALAERGIEVGVLSPGPGEGEIDEDGIRHFTVPIGRRPGGKLLSFALKVPGAIERLSESFPPDLIHSHFGPGAFLSRRTLESSPLIETAHGTHLGELLALRPLRRLLPREILGKFSLYPVLAALDLLCYRKCARIIAVSEMARQEVSRYGRGLLGKTVVVPNGIRLAEFPLEISPSPSGEREIRCLTVAFMQARKGLDYLLEAVRNLPRGDVRFTIVGDGPHLARLKRLSHRLGVAERVTFTGRVGREALRDEFRRSDIFVLPSLWEGQGIVFLEAAASGLPVVATDIPGVCGMLEHGVNALLVPPRDSLALAREIERLAASSGLRQRLASEGLRRVRGYDWNELVRQVISLYSSILEESTRGE
ncbi:MAG: glycosyltransferase family 4 protein [Candidatus Eiseniibacteriota bacterium]|nr:MAG: glycosyltransferase family 4 protein [Candidatus Eisenbacteria bacterium]